MTSFSDWTFHFVLFRGIKAKLLEHNGKLINCKYLNNKFLIALQYFWWEVNFSMMTQFKETKLETDLLIILFFFHEND